MVEPNVSQLDTYVAECHIPRPLNDILKWLDRELVDSLWYTGTRSASDGTLEFWAVLDSIVFEYVRALPPIAAGELHWGDVDSLDTSVNLARLAQDGWAVRLSEDSRATIVKLRAVGTPALVESRALWELLVQRAGGHWALALPTEVSAGQAADAREGTACMLPKWFPKNPRRQDQWKLKADAMHLMDVEYIEAYEEGATESPTVSYDEYRERIVSEGLGSLNSDDTLRNIRRARDAGLI